MKNKSSIILGFIAAFRDTPGVVLRILLFLILAGGVVLGLWAIGLIGETGRDTIQPPRTVQINQSSVHFIRILLQEYDARVMTINASRYKDPFR